MQQAVPLVEEVIIRSVARFRKELGWSQDRLAREVSLRTGWLWNRGTVMAIERGTRNLGVHEWLAIAIALRQPPWSFFSAESQIKLGPRSQPFNPNILQDAVNDAWAQASARGPLPKRSRGGVKAAPGDAAARDSLQEAEKNAAVKLKVDAQSVVAAAYKLWRHSLTEERERRILRAEAGDRSALGMRAHRGHITRELLAELQQELSGGM